jgi:hypothetical protein
VDVDMGWNEWEVLYGKKGSTKEGLFYSVVYLSPYVVPVDDKEFSSEEKK